MIVWASVSLFIAIYECFYVAPNSGWSEPHIFYISGSGQILAPASTPTPTSTPAPAPTSTPVSTLKHVMFTLKQLPLN